MIIRAETERDAAAVRHVNEQAFGQPDEADLVDALRLTNERCRSFVAETEERAIAGHILFTPVTVHDDEPAPSWSALALGPIAVLPERQRTGIGSSLMRHGLARCLEEDQLVVFVLGHPEYYPRFGFRPAPPLGLTCKWPVPDDVFMVNELRPGALAGRRGRVAYAPAFDAC